MRKWLLIITLFVTLPCYSQDSDIFAPFVTQLNAEIRNNLIRLSWVDSGDIKGPVYLYRSETPLSGDSNLPAPIEIPYGTESYLDEAEKPGNLYYYIAASDESNTKYTITIPFTNTASVTVKPENVGYSGTGATAARQGGASALSPALPGSGIQGINAQIEGDRVTISFNGVDRDRNPILYRSILPIRRPEDLLSALIIRQRVASPYVDRPLPGITYYYAVIYEEELAAGVLSIRPGNNVTGAVEIPSSRKAAARTAPLPGLAFSPPPGYGQFALNPDTARTDRSVQPGSDTRVASYIFPEDLAARGSGEEYQLRTIVQDYFFLRNWEGTQRELTRFLELPRGKQNNAKAHFYLGQAYFFQGMPREALFSFLQAQETYPVESNFWIQTVLGRLIR
jgi:tetratricopeptide (TPR) repeat protein